MSKKDLRIKYKNIRNSIENTSALGEKIFSQLIDSYMYKTADIVLAYWSVGSEVDTRRIIDKALEDKKKVAFPKCTDKNGNMIFCYISAVSDLSDGMYGIKEPINGVVADSFTESSICLVPGLSFDKCGYRLGYGKGYYDRFLSNFCGTSIGLCYESCLCEELPREEFDKHVDYLITDIKIFNNIKEE